MYERALRGCVCEKSRDVYKRALRVRSLESQRRVGSRWCCVTVGEEKVTRSVGKCRESEGLERKCRLEVCGGCGACSGCSVLVPV